MRMDQHNHILKAQLQRKILKNIRFRPMQTYDTVHLHGLEYVHVGDPIGAPTRTRIAETVKYGQKDL